ncbi:MAG: hypothetical protein KC996_06755 [Phycisphaerales bacterium]|nr:hypothetical protein [Phycisphaerales bacterium]
MPNHTPLFDGSAEPGLDKHATSTSSPSANRTEQVPLPQSHAPEFADMLLDLAAAVEAQEAAIKALLLEAAEAGNLDLVRKITRVWADGPVSEVMAQLRAESSVDSSDARVA